ncbi:glycoside hydrolase TIM-barrel-like domain-containing protein [Henriciella sp.]|jgi:hypothetical protein|uniref:baseplate multidomain protein megatron n=1 Tax=Henriciella sp. TaxID=1968823 RepID=UPI0025B91605|nr:glycoside hydrolase TIM-barrel-like domain-containing protein [Henriciella sp.]|tara:strand:+ start:14705 stop:18388 length:3684 start_codon:yes stop_codon:yes gene_type:complete
MGQIILSQAGQSLGQALLPNGLGLFGANVGGAAIGGALGSLAGRAIDSAFSPDVNGPRMGAMTLMESREGAGLQRVYGRGRVGGQVIWAAQFKEKRTERSAGKGGPKVRDYTYSLSFAVSVADGPISRLGRIWANGEIMDLAGLNWHLYRGDENQLPDPLIEAVEGAGQVPAFRVTAYIVFEDLPLAAYGNRLPQLSFEVFGAAGNQADLNRLVEGVNIIPASGEFVYGTSVVRERRFPGVERALNMNNTAGEADFARSLSQMTAEFPRMRQAALTVAWFGDDLRAEACRIRPGVETRTRRTVPYGWSVAGQGREAARLISQTGGAANYGGTPSDPCVIEAITAMKAEGLSVTLSPFLLMDIPPDNRLPDPYGGSEQAAFPWRGRITVQTPDGTKAVREAIGTLFGADGAFGYRHFILHHARLAEEAGGVEAFLLGSEMQALSRLRDETGAFPFVDELVALAGEVRAILGETTKISYAANWTEYGAYVPADGSGDVLFPLDVLWACEDIDFVGVDWYPPIGDWRDGNDHLDALAGYDGPEDEAYLRSQLQGGEAYDWYYASEAARAQQVRSPIMDEAHGEAWVFRQKDILNWWSSAHHERPAGTRNAAPTGWSPGLKPVRLMELGFPAVDLGTNAPNLFHDPKSAESAFPPFSSGVRNDVLQRKALEVSLAYWSAQPCIEAVHAWAWDARPFPDFPARETIWSDGPNWALGHWLNGRSGLVSVGDVICDLARQAGIEMEVVALEGLVEGLVLSGPTSLRQVMEPLHALYRFRCLEREDGLLVTEQGAAPHPIIPVGQTGEDGVSITHVLLDKLPGRLELGYVDGAGAYGAAQAEARAPEGDGSYTVRAALPLILSEAAAQKAAADLLRGMQEGASCRLELGPSYWGLEPGDRLAVETVPGSWVIDDIIDDGLGRTVSLSRPVEETKILAASIPDSGKPAVVPADPELFVVDTPAISRFDGSGPLVAAAGRPWRGPVQIEAGRSLSLMSGRASLSYPAHVGQLLTPLYPGPTGRWDKAGAIELELETASISSADPLSVLAGANTLLVQGEAGWEAISFRTAELIDTSRWRLTDLLRGLHGSTATAAEEGAAVILVDGTLGRAEVAYEEVGTKLLWRAEGGEARPFTYLDRAGLPWPVAHLKTRRQTGGTVELSWLPRGPDIPDSWDLPDPVHPRQFAVEGESPSGTLFTLQTSANRIETGADVHNIRVAEIGTDGRYGPWVSIAAEAL